MRLIRKIFNKIIFASVVAIVFALFNRCEVKAQEKTITMHIPTNEMEVSFTIDTDDYPYYYGTMRYDSSGYFNIYLYYSEEPLYYKPMQSSYCGVNTDYSGTPCYGGMIKSSSSTVYYLKKSFRTSDSELVYSSTSPEVKNKNSSIGYFIVANYNFTDFVDYADSFYGYTSTGFPKIQDYDILWVLSHDLYNYNDQDSLVLSTIYINDLVAPDAPSVEFSPNYVKVNKLYVAINVLVNVLNNDWTTNSVYYSFCDEDSECTYDTLEWVQLYYDNFLHLEDGDKTSLHFDNNGYLFIKIVDNTTNEVVYATSTHISALSTQDPDINLNINYNSSNNTIIDEILIDTDYNIYSSNLTGYKCYYTFSTSLLENPQISDFTETDCQAGRLYVAHNNGYYYARITYNDEPVVDIMKEINEYGQLVSTIYNTNSNDIFTKLLGGTNGYLSIYTSNQGPLHSLVSLPLKLGTFIYQFFTLDNACTPYDMGTIFNRHIVIGCVDLSILGSPLLHTIDIIFAGFFTITWGLFLYKLLRKIVILKDISVEGVFRGGIF